MDRSTPSEKIDNYDKITKISLSFEKGNQLLFKYRNKNFGSSFQVTIVLGFGIKS